MSDTNPNQGAGPRIVDNSRSTHRMRILLLPAAWLGLVTGLIEGGGLLFLQHRGWLAWQLAQMGVSADIVWVSAFVDLIVFLALGLILWAISAVVPRMPVFSAGLFVFTSVSFTIWLTVIGRMRYSAILVLGLGLGSVITRWARIRELRVMSFCRRTLPWVAAVGLTAFAVIEAGGWLHERWIVAGLPKPAPDSPNVVIIVVDTLRSDHLSTYGYSRLTTPTLTRLAHDGVLFENTFAPSSWTLPSHASLLTGRYPHEHRLESGGQVLDNKYPTLAEVLRDRGYRTGAFSGNNFWFCRHLGFGRGFAHFEDYFTSLADGLARTIVGRDVERFILHRIGLENVPGRRSAADINTAALRWIDQDKSRPFFVFLNYFDVHDPYLPPQPYRSKFSKIKNPGGIINSFVLRDYPRLTPEELQSEIDAYDGGISYVDDQIAELILELNARGVMNHTLLVVTSDHGESFGEHGLLGHRDALYREVIEVPLIFYWPAHVPGTIRVTTPVSNVAIPATILQLVEDRNQQTFPGPSLTRLWTKGQNDADWPLPLSELAQMPFEVAKRNPAYSGWLKSLTSTQWHYILHQKNGAELYAWKSDPNEVSNVAATASGHELVTGFSESLESMLGQSTTAWQHANTGP
jgi:arylsulfatase A-like enzyme